MARRSRSVAGLAAAGLVAGGITLATGPSASAFGYDSLNRIQQRLVSGTLSVELGTPQGTAAPSGRAATAQPADDAALRNYFPGPNGQCSIQHGMDIKVNQNCANATIPGLEGRGQAQNETWAAVDPLNSQHLIVTYNDYRRGDGTCGESISLDGGRTYQDVTVPNGFTQGVGSYARQYWQAGGDTSVEWDTRGNAYFSCQVFDRGVPVTQSRDQSSALLIFRSTGNDGASWNFPGNYAAVLPNPKGIPALLDKPLMTVDDHTSSPFRDRVYVTYTLFAADGTAYIYAVHSSDFGQTFSKPVLVSSANRLCRVTFGVPTPQGPCNENQDSQPFVGRDGTLYVVYNNYNNKVTGKDNRNQVLLARSTDGGASFGHPTLVSTYYDLPDCVTYTGQDAGRGCVPAKGPNQDSFFRADNYPIGAADPTDPNHVVVTFGSYINRDSNESIGCKPAGFNPQTGLNLYTGVISGPCNNDIVLSSSTDGGRSFTGATTDVRHLPVLTAAPGQARTDQYWQAARYAANGVLEATYLDRQYGNDEQTGYSDVTLEWVHGLTPTAYQRETSSSMPPPTQFAGLFYGDYIGMGVAPSGQAYPAWSDTRDPEPFTCPAAPSSASPPRLCLMPAPNAALANDQNIYTTLPGTS